MEDKSLDNSEPNQYEHAMREWDARIGSAKTQASNWRLACILSLLITILLLLGIYLLLNSQKRYVYVAQVQPNDGVVNVQAVGETYQANQVQEVYMLGRFINNIMSLPLDPIVARNQWMSAYNLVSGRAVQQLNDFASKNDPFADLGELTKTITIKNFTALSNHSYEFTWTQTVYNANGNVVGTTLYSGIFMVSTDAKAKTISALLDNPYGIKIAYFTISAEGH